MGFAKIKNKTEKLSRVVSTYTAKLSAIEMTLNEKLPKKKKKFLNIYEIKQVKK